MAPPQAISILCQMELNLFMSPTYGFLVGAILAKGCTPDFNNGLGGGLNSGPFWPPSVYLSPTRIMVSPQAISILCQMELNLFMSPTYGFLAGAILAKGCRPDFNNGLKGDLNSGLILAPRRSFESDSNNGHLQAIPILNCKHELAQNLLEASFRRT